MSLRSERLLLALIAICYMTLATLYSLVTPLFEASDELWHYPMVKYLADHGLRLPPQDPTAAGPWRQEGSQPPLYYMLAALLTAGIDTSDLDEVRRINPHADIGVVRPDGNVNMIVHHQEREAWPWSGTVLAVRLSRFFSVLLGLGTVLVSYHLARAVLPDEPVIALLAAALTAFLPMFLFISGSVNNDNLSNFVGNLLTLLIVRLANTRRPPRRLDYALLGLTMGAGLLSKLNIGFMIPLVALSLLVISARLRTWQPLIYGGLISGALTIAIAGWWYWRNWQLYGDPSGVNRFLDIVGRRAIPANAAQLWSERESFLGAFWGYFGGMNVPLPDAVYLVFNLTAAVGFIGATAFLLRRFVLLRRLPGPAMTVTLLWPAITFVSFLRWTAETPASQGRLLFGALSSITLWVAVGLLWWLPRRAQWGVGGSVAAGCAAISLAAPLLIIAPAYATPTPLNPAPAEVSLAQFSAPGENGEIRLTNASVISQDVQPENYVAIDLAWQIDEPSKRDWSLFVHLVTADNVILSQRDVYPGGGTLATSDLPAGFHWQNMVSIWTPFTAYAPMALDVQVGWYHQPTGERMMLADGHETLSVGLVQLKPRESALDVPNPVQVNFGGLIELVGYELTDLSPQAGDTLELTLYWRGRQTMSDDYKVFANIIDPGTLTKYAASDGMPVNWSAPTSTWQPGVLIEDTHELYVNPETPTVPGIYELELGLYREAPDGTFPRLRIFTRDGGQAEDFIRLSRVRVLPAEEGE